MLARSIRKAVGAFMLAGSIRKGVGAVMLARSNRKRGERVGLTGPPQYSLPGSLVGAVAETQPGAMVWDTHRPWAAMQMHASRVLPPSWSEADAGGGLEKDMRDERGSTADRKQTRTESGTSMKLASFDAAAKPYSFIFPLSPLFPTDGKQPKRTRHFIM